MLDGIIGESFSGLTSEQVIARLDEAQIANSRLNTMQDVWTHPQLQARQRWTSVQTPAGEVPALLPPGADAASISAVPEVGEHSASILAELGYGDSDVQHFRDKQVI